MAEVDSIFSSMPQSFVAGSVAEPVSYYFSLGEVKKTVELDPQGCTVSDGKVLERADCVCKTTQDFFLRIWQEKYRPGLKDFLGGTIKSNDPEALKVFLKCFGKDG